MGGSSGGGGSSSTKIRYAEYIEAYHQRFLLNEEIFVGALATASPFSGYTTVPVNDAFFGVGYSITSFPAAYDMYGKFMAGLDIEALWDQLMTATTSSTLVDDLVAAEAALMDDDITTTQLPRMQTGMRDINAVNASSFVIGQAIIEDARTKSLAKFQAQLRYDLIPIAQSRWTTHLQWNQQVISIYLELMKFYYASKNDMDEKNYSMAAKHLLWPFTVLDYERAGLGALQGAINQKTDVAGASTAAKMSAGALSGAAMGAMIGKEVGGTSPYGAAAGAGIGAILGAIASR